MKILFVSALLPYPLHSGGQIRVYNLLKRLGEKHEITLCAFVRDTNEVGFVDKLRFCRYVYVIHRGRAWQPRYLIKTVFGRYPFLLTTYDNRAMHELIDGLIKPGAYDLVHLEPFYVWPSVPDVTLPMVVSEHNIEYAVYETYVRRFPIPLVRPLMFIDTLKLRFWEGYVWRKADAVTSVSEADAAVIRKLSGQTPTVVPNGVDLASFRYQVHKNDGKGPKLLFVGNFAWLPNRDAAQKLVHDIWPVVKQRFPQAKLKVVGRNMSASLRRRLKSVGADWAEDVANIEGEYHQADMLVSPTTIGGGTKFKILEAFASGLPVVTSKEGVLGIAVKAGEHYLEANATGEYVAQIAKLWENSQIRELVTKVARKLVEEKYNWDQIADTIDGVWRQTYAQAKT